MRKKQTREEILAKAKERIKRNYSSEAGKKRRKEISKRYYNKLVGTPDKRAEYNKKMREYLARRRDQNAVKIQE